ncbi:MAG: NAD(P)-binding domain-containing protein [Acidobacteriia bacterium]|nr:NAD(P)-binding domain-containing protein [Terriglobia bacterium]
MTDVAIIGAGPYGLSVAAHLKARGVDFRIFGHAMSTWLNHMPKGMRLKSEGFASCLYDPKSELTLEKYCQAKGLPYQDVGLPVPLETFSSYGLEFQQRFVPNLENKLVTSLSRESVGFKICLDNGEVVAAKKVVIAVGLSYFAQVPSRLSALSEEFVTHSRKHNTVDRFKGREVAVVGAGASALDLAAILHQNGASVQVIARKPEIRFQGAPRLPRPLLKRFRAPMTTIGPGWQSVFCTEAPLLFRQLPESIRLEAVRKILGPAPCWFTKDEVVGKVAFHTGVGITKVEARNNRVSLELTDSAGARRVVSADHVIAATGYKVDLRRITFFNQNVLARIASVEETPVLSSNFESSIPDLYFLGILAANTFGPVLRFACGAGFAARRLSHHLARSASRSLAKGDLTLVNAPSNTESN